MLSVGSLCTGYGGLEMGLQAVYDDIDLRFVSDIDKDANTLLAHHNPNVPNLGDLTVIDWADIEPVDVLCAGYPCQPFSTAGKRKGLEDERAIFEYIADAISVLRPTNVLLENVAGHLTLGGTTVIATLTRLGYNAKWGIVRACDAGAPHQRKRIFIWADNGNAKKRHAGNTKQQPMAETTRSTAEFRKPNSEITTNTGNERCDTRRGQFKATQQRQTQERAKRNIELSRGNSVTTDSDSARLQRLRGECELAENSGQKRFTWGDYEPAIRRWETVMGTPAPHPAHKKGVNTVFVEWLMGLPEGYVTDIGLSRKAQLKMLGNGVVPQQAALALQLLAEGGYYAKTA